MSDEYTPIPCATHSEYELYIMRQQKLRLVFNEQSDEVTDVIAPIDIITSEGAT